ncbi:MAG: phenylalanine--tRNA ligase subunit beta [Ferrovum sp. 37-45-19]|nr:MAG: phenylalanine--tRNA ligase subunit beta [Ferrovum sp. 21-44-67]OYV94122.1 MAG: phenylalanine--tRNA ligase subunit beta [Ferrovum sp. 37-45-19]HQT81388.1 phenylalanine--tRNA ligase subunit beta [Ferrovaceae bacterium]HQU06275.1 phenylalanine--tRNA ligase subunit beta [Ferrovaceae bacterium]
MKFSESWLKTLINYPWASTELAHSLTMAGIEVEALESVAPPFSGVVVGLVLSAHKHPEADRLKVLSVDVGRESPLQIVCGASNVVVGMKAPCATVGAILPGDFKIKEAKLRGVASFGMMCSEKELGLKEEADGLMVLDPAAKVGQDIRESLRLDDQVLTLKLTPNRADCLSLLGVAREVSALTNLAITPPVFTLVEPLNALTREVINQVPQACPQYVGRQINLTNPTAATPPWMVERLQRSGIKSHGVVVDVTNYVLLETGQPLHAFDDQQIEGAVVVRWAHDKEPLVLLNEQQVSLSNDVLVIADESKVLAIAGIMGGLESAVTENSRHIFLEAAFFTPQAIAGRARRFNLSTDSSHRFERGVDFAYTVHAIERATALLIEICGGEALPLIKHISTLPSRPSCLVRVKRVERVLGMHVTQALILDLFTRLGLKAEQKGEDVEVTPASYRFDLSIEEDYIEEIARLIGYDHIPELPAVGELKMYSQPASLQLEYKLQEQLVARDYQEAISYSFISEEWQACFTDPQQESLTLINPIASHLSVMRTSIWPGLLQALAVNLAKQVERVRLFEMGRCFYKEETGRIEQPKKLALLAYGKQLNDQWGEKSRTVDFYDMKADVEALLHGQEVSFDASQHKGLHPGRQARIFIGDLAVGYLGELHPRLVKQLGLPQSCLLAELDLDNLNLNKLPSYRESSKYPPVTRDLAVIVEDKVVVGTLLATLKPLIAPPIQDLFLFDLYRGPGVPQGKKSLAFRIVMQDTEKTLTDIDIDLLVTKVLQKLKSEFQAELR